MPKFVCKRLAVRLPCYSFLRKKRGHVIQACRGEKRKKRSRISLLAKFNPWHAAVSLKMVHVLMFYSVDSVKQQRLQAFN